MQAQRKENDSSDIEENQCFGNSDRINSINFNATTLKFAEKFDHPFSHFFIFGSIFALGHVFDTMMVTISKFFVSFYSLDREKFMVS